MSAFGRWPSVAVAGPGKSSGLWPAREPQNHAGESVARSAERLPPSGEVHGRRRDPPAWFPRGPSPTRIRCPCPAS